MACLGLLFWLESQPASLATLLLMHVYYRFTCIASMDKMRTGYARKEIEDKDWKCAEG